MDTLTACAAVCQAVAMTTIVVRCEWSAPLALLGHAVEAPLFHLHSRSHLPRVYRALFNTYLIYGIHFRPSDFR